MSPSGTPSHITTLPTAIRRTSRTAGGDQGLRTGDTGTRERRRSAGDPLQDLGVDVEVRVHGVGVVLVLERVDQAHQLDGAVLVERDEALGPLRDRRLLDLHP